MRVIVILFLGVAVIALVLKYFPASETGAENAILAAEGPVQEKAPTSRFLPPPASVTEQAPREIDREKPRETLKPAPNTTKGGLKSAANLRDVPELAGALLHLDPKTFLTFLESADLGLSEERKKLLLAFSLAMTGKPTEAVNLAPDLEPGNGIKESEFALLKSAVQGEWTGARAASSSRTGSVEFAMELALLAREGKRLLDRREWKPAAEALSTVLLADIRAPWTSSWDFSRTWGARLNAAQAHHRWNPKGSWDAVDEKVNPGDSLSTIRARVVKANAGLLLCTGLIDRVNGIGDRYLQAGETLRIPMELVSTVVDLEARHAFFLFGDEVAAVWPVAIGAPGNDTPEGVYVVGELIPEPPWFRPGEPMIPFGDPGNLLGTRWVGWNDEDGSATHYGFHGTWEPETIGQAVSDGCIRLRNADVEDLYQIIPRGTAVTVQL